MIKTILGIETSCDETAAAVLQQEGDRITILSNVVASSMELQSKWGGVVPEQAAREQLKSMIPVVTEALEQAHLKPEDLDAIAVTQGPGLIGSLLVGVETAKTLALIWDKPLIPINHLIGHFFANWIETESSQTVPTFPCVGLLVSGGHTDLVLFKSPSDYKYLGGTRDDAAGECFDKSARILNLPYPGGPEISKQATLGNSKIYPLPEPMKGSKDFDFSFSGLKTAVSNLVQSVTLNEQVVADICASLENTICETLLHKTVAAIKDQQVDQLIVAGGVAANKHLQEEFKTKAVELKIKLNIPPAKLCTDNAAMIAAAAFFHHPVEDPLSIQANPNLSLLS